MYRRRPEKIASDGDTAASHVNARCDHRVNGWKMDELQEHYSYPSGNDSRPIGKRPARVLIGENGILLCISAPDLSFRNDLLLVGSLTIQK